MHKKCIFCAENSMVKSEKNEEFYTNCTKYFEFLRKHGASDFEFEDEYYFTMPAISSK